MNGARGVAFLIALAALALVPAIATAADAPFYIGLVTRIMVFAIAAVSLDLILGYAGLVSFGHAAYFGIGAYAVGILSFHGIGNGFVHFAVAVLAAAAAALAIGFVSLRTSGVYFIMITLAFGQMVYFLGVSVNRYGGDDGLNISRHSDFAGLIDLADLWDIVGIEGQSAFVALNGTLPELLRLRHPGFAETVAGIPQIVECALLQRAVRRGGRTFKECRGTREIVAVISRHAFVVKPWPGFGLRQRDGREQQQEKPGSHASLLSLTNDSTTSNANARPKGH